MKVNRWYQLVVAVDEKRTSYRNRKAENINNTTLYNIILDLIINSYLFDLIHLLYNTTRASNILELNYKKV